MIRILKKREVQDPGDERSPGAWTRKTEQEPEEERRPGAWRGEKIKILEKKQRRSGAWRRKRGIQDPGKERSRSWRREIRILEKREVQDPGHKRRSGSWRREIRILASVCHSGAAMGRTRWQHGLSPVPCSEPAAPRPSTGAFPAPNAASPQSPAAPGDRAAPQRRLPRAGPSRPLPARCPLPGGGRRTCQTPWEQRVAGCGSCPPAVPARPMTDIPARASRTPHTAPGHIPEPLCRADSGGFPSFPRSSHPFEAGNERHSAFRCPARLPGSGCGHKAPHCPSRGRRDGRGSKAGRTLPTGTNKSIFTCPRPVAGQGGGRGGLNVAYCHPRPAQGIKRRGKGWGDWGTSKKALLPPQISPYLRWLSAGLSPGVPARN